MAQQHCGRLFKNSGAEIFFSNLTTRNLILARWDKRSIVSLSLEVGTPRIIVVFFSRSIPVVRNPRRGDIILPSPCNNKWE